MEDYSNEQHRSYLEESHHAVQYIADNFGMVSTKTKHVSSFTKAEKTAFASMWTRNMHVSPQVTETFLNVTNVADMNPAAASLCTILNDSCFI